MANIYRLREQLLRDQRITEDEVAVIREFIERDGKLDLDDVRFLVDLLSDAREVCSAFDDLFFPVLREVILADGRVGLDEHFYLLKMLYSNGQIRQRERQFLSELRAAVEQASPELDALCAEVGEVPACR